MENYNFLESITSLDNDVLIPINRIQYVTFGYYENGYQIKIKSDNGEWHECFGEQKEKARFRYIQIQKILHSSHEPKKTLIEELPLSTRTYRVLIDNDINTIDDIFDQPFSSLLKMPNFGRKSYKELARVLMSEGFDIGKF